VRRPVPDPVGPGQVSVWSYPRPPRVEPEPRRLRVRFGGRVIADTTRAVRVLETSHPPNYYVPIDDVAPGVLDRGARTSWCEFKGQAHYFAVRSGDRVAADAAWGYDTPSPGYEALADTVAFYAGPMDECLVDEEVAVAQPGGFYGGWITDDVAGPFKGGPGTNGW
jgi:uncharacterized protein (DUF427 family)